MYRCMQKHECLFFMCLSLSVITPLHTFDIIKLLLFENTKSNSDALEKSSYNTRFPLFSYLMLGSVNFAKL